MKKNITKENNQILNCIIPIFKLGKYKEPLLLGSSVLIKIADHFFLISAAHVFEEFDEDNHLFIACNNDIYPLNGSLSIGNPNKLKEDIAIFYLDEKLNNIILKTYLPLTLSMNCEILKSNDYFLFIIGFPGNKSKTVVKTKTVKLLNFNVQTEFLNKEDRINTHPSSKIFDVKYPKKNDNNKIVHPRGMSGGGVFKFFLNESNNYEIYLTGINLSYSREKNSQFNTMRIMNAHIINTILLLEYPFLSKYINQFSKYFFSI